MARKKLPPSFELPKETYYAYYDKISKVLLAITNEVHPEYTDFLEVDFDTYERLVSGKEKFSDYLLGHVKEEEKTVLKLMPKLEHAYHFKNTMLEIIVDDVTKNTDLIVEWNNVNKEWNFFLSQEGKSRLAQRTTDSKILFFVILESDYNFLIRTIDINSNDLVTKYCVGIPFTTDIETQLDKISIATKLIFESYGLRKIDE